MKQTDCNLPLLGFAGYSGSGKTTLLKKLIPALQQSGVVVAVIKHAHHRFDIDTPGKDSYELRAAGANQVLVASHSRWALMTETAKQQSEPDLAYLISRLDFSSVDLILVEGFKHEAIAKFEITRDKPAELYHSDANVIAVISNSQQQLPDSMPQLDLNNIDAIVKFILYRIEQQNTLRQP